MEDTHQTNGASPRFLPLNLYNPQTQTVRGPICPELEPTITTYTMEPWYNNGAVLFTTRSSFSKTLPELDQSRMRDSESTQDWLLCIVDGKKKKQKKKSKVFIIVRCAAYKAQLAAVSSRS